MHLFTSILLSPLLIFSATGATTIESSICAPLTQPSIVSPAAGQIPAGATFVSGTSDSGSTVVVKSDNQTIGTTTADSLDSFGVTVSIPAGQHTLKVVASNPCMNSTSDEVIVTAIAPPQPPGDPEDPPEAPQPTPTPTPSPEGSYVPPRPSTGGDGTAKPPTKDLVLLLDSALDGSVVSEPSVYISGTLSADGTVTILDGDKVLAVLIVTDGIFGARIPLSVGKNTLTIVAESGGRKVETEITITRRSPGDGASELPWYQSPLVLVAGASVVLIGAGAWLSLAIHRNKLKESEKPWNPLS